MDSRKYFGICIAVLSLQVQNSHSESSPVVTATTTAPSNNTYEWFVYHQLINGSYEWNATLQNSSSQYYLNLSNQAQREFSERNIIIIFFQRVYILRFNARNISLGEYVERIGSNENFFSGPPRNDTDGHYLQPLRFSLLGARNDSNVTEFLGEYLKCFYKTQEVSNLTVVSSNEVMVNFAAAEGNLTNSTSWGENTFFGGPPLHKLIFEETNDTTQEPAFDLSTCEGSSADSTNPLANTSTTISTSSTAAPTTISSSSTTVPTTSGISSLTLSTTMHTSLTTSPVLTTKTTNPTTTTIHSVSASETTSRGTTQTGSIHSTTTGQAIVSNEPQTVKHETTTISVQTTSDNDGVSDIIHLSTATGIQDTSQLQSTTLEYTTPFSTTTKSETTPSPLVSLLNTMENPTTLETGVTTNKPGESSVGAQTQTLTMQNKLTTAQAASSLALTTAYSNPVCNSITLVREGQSLTFPSILLSDRFSSSDQTCDDGKRPLASIRCVESHDEAIFDNNSVTMLNCSENIGAILQAQSSNYTQEEVIDTFRNLELQLPGTSSNDAEDLNNVADYILNTSTAFEEISEVVMQSVLSIANTIGRRENFEPMVYSKVVKAIEQYAQRLELSGNRSMNTVGNITSKSVVVNPAQNFATTVIVDGEEAVSVFIPSSAFDSASSRVDITYFNNSIFFPSNGPESPRSVISISLPGAVVAGLDTTIEITFTTENETQGKVNNLGTLKATKTVARCVFYDNNSLQWSTEGVYVDTSSQPISCHTTHLTSFAVIVIQTEAIQTISLSIVSTVGCILTIIGTAATIILHIITGKWRKNRPIMEMLHACFCIFVTYIIFLCGVENAANRGSCIAVTALLQYFFLATWCWLFVYSRDMYTSIVKVFTEHQSRYMMKMMILSYGVPLLVVIIHVSIVIGYFDNEKTLQTIDKGPVITESYYYSDHVCWLVGYSLYVGFLIPVGLVILHNLAVISLVIYEIAWKSVAIESSAQRKDAKSNVVLGVVIFFLVGGTWAFMYLLIISDEITYQTVMSWIFAILNSLQGFTIFIILCVKSKEMRKVWTAPLRNKIYLPVMTTLRGTESGSYEDKTLSKTTFTGSSQFSDGSPSFLKRNNKISDSSGDLSLGRINYAFESETSLTKDNTSRPSTAGTASSEEIAQTTAFDIEEENNASSP